MKQSIETKYSFLINDIDIEKSYFGRAITEDLKEQSRHFIMVVVGGRGSYINSAISVIQLWGDNIYGGKARRVELLKAPLYSDRVDPIDVVNTIVDCKIDYPNAIVVINNNGAGHGFEQLLDNKKISYEVVDWWKRSQNEQSRKEFSNQRSQAYVSLARAIKTGRFKIRTNHLKSEIKNQATSIAVDFDHNGRFKVLDKISIKNMGGTPPDILDHFAFAYLESLQHSYLDDYPKKILASSLLG
jgi:hypothetical protein